MKPIRTCTHTHTGQPIEEDSAAIESLGHTHTHTDTHTHTHNLIYAYILHTGKPIEEDSAVLESLGVTDGATIHLVLRSF
jgi:hypothetical protein